MTTPDAGGTAGDAGAFSGAKAVFFCGTRLLCYLRDDRPDLPWPGRWDLPGGGREGSETPEGCLLRELAEEFGLSLAPDRLELRLAMPAMHPPPALSFFFAGHLTPSDIAAIRFGDEGQRWEMMEVDSFLTHPMGIPVLQDRVRQAMAAFPAGSRASGRSAPPAGIV